MRPAKIKSMNEYRRLELKALEDISCQEIRLLAI